MSLIQPFKIAALLCFVFLSASNARAESDVLHFRVEKDGVFVELLAGEFNTTAEMNDQAKSLADEIAKGKTANGEQNFLLETGYADFEAERGPSQVGDEKPSGKKFNQALNDALGNQNIEAQAQGLNLDKTPKTLRDYYHQFGGWGWTMIRVGTVSGIVYAHEMITPGHANAAIALATPSFVGIITTAFLSNWLNTKQGNSRWKVVEKTALAYWEKKNKLVASLYENYENTMTKWFGAEAKQKAFEKINSVPSEAWLADWHSKSFFGTVEVVFSTALNIPKSGLQIGSLFSIRGIFERYYLPDHSSSMIEILVSAGAVTWTQEALEAALFRYYKARVKEGKLSKGQLDMLRKPLSSLGSVFAVTGMILATTGSGFNLNKVIGYAMLGVLKAGGIYFGKWVDKNYGKFLVEDVVEGAKIIQCDHNIGGDLLEKNSPKGSETGSWLWDTHQIREELAA